MAGGAGSSIGRGGMITKVLAAKRAAGSGASTVIAWGREPDVLLRLARRRDASARRWWPAPPSWRRAKQWMVDHLQMRGAVVVDDGAVAKLRDEGKSLLPIGMVHEVHGEFVRGDVIAVKRLLGGGAGGARPGQLFGGRGSSDRAEGLQHRSNRCWATPTSPRLIHRDQSRAHLSGAARARG